MYDASMASWRLEVLDLLLSKISFVLVPLLGAENKYIYFSHVAGIPTLFYVLKKN